MTTRTSPPKADLWRPGLQGRGRFQGGGCFYAARAKLRANNG